MEQFLQQVLGSLPGVLVAILFLIIAFIVAKLAESLVKKLLKAPSVKSALAKVDEKTGGKSLVDLISKAVFLLVFLLFLPGVLNRLNIQGVSEPITNFVSNIINYVPLLLAAGVLVYVGFYVAGIVKSLAEGLLEKFGVNKLQQKYAPVTDENARLSNILSSLLYVLIVVPVVVAALDVLGLKAVSQPAVAMFNSALAYLPKIFVAAVLVYVGVFLSNIVAKLLHTILVGTKVDSLKDELKLKGDFSLSQVASQAVKYLLVLFFALEAVKVLELQVFSSIGETLLSYLPSVLSALVLVLAALFGSRFVETLIKKNGGSDLVALVAKSAIFVVVGFMVLSQLGIAKNIIETAFVIVMAAFGIAFAISFGLGGKDFAKKSLEKVEKNLDK